MTMLGASNFLCHNGLFNFSLINWLLINLVYYRLLEFFMNYRTFKWFFDYLLMTFMNHRLWYIVDHLLVGLMDHWLMNLSDFFFMDYRQMVLMDYVLVLLMNNILVVFMNHVFMMLMNNVFVVLLNNWFFNYCLYSWGKYVSLYLSRCSMSLKDSLLLMSYDSWSFLISNFDNGLSSSIEVLGLFGGRNNLRLIAHVCNIFLSWEHILSMIEIMMHQHLLLWHLA